jgi:alkylation response protein AidB-like acyl-CoA dehydrogenase
LPQTCDGRSIMAFALTEPTAGSDLSSISTRFEDKGDHFLLNGKKHWIGNGTSASVMTTYAKEVGGSHHGRVSAFIVDTNSDGISIVWLRDKMGQLTIKNAEIYFHNCVVPKKNLD